MKNNRGFTLVEFIVAFAIAAIAGVAVFSFMSASSNSFNKTNKDVGLQYEQQIVVNQIRDYILESSNAINYDAASNALYTYTQIDKEVDSTDPTTGSTITETKVAYRISKIYLVKAADAEVGEIYVESQDVMDISDTSYKDNFDGSSKSLLGSDVKDFTVDLSRLEKNKVGFTITFLSNEKEASSEQVVALRNTIVDSDNLGEIYSTTRTELNSFIDSITINRDGKSFGVNETDEIGIVTAGQPVQVQYTATVRGNEYSTRTYDGGVTWELKYPVAGISVGNDGIVTVGGKDADGVAYNYSSGQTVTLIARSIDDPSKTQSLLIKITDNGIYPIKATLTNDAANNVDGNGYREYSLIPKITYTGKVNDTTGESFLEGADACSRITWKITETASGGTDAYVFDSAVMENLQESGVLNLSSSANGKTFRILITVNQLDQNGEKVQAYIDLSPTDIPEYNPGISLSLSTPESALRGTSFVASLSAKAATSSTLKYYFKVIPYRGTDKDSNNNEYYTSAEWNSDSVGLKSNFSKTISIETSGNNAATSVDGDSTLSSEFSSYGYFDDTIGANSWYKSKDYQHKLATVDVASYLDWDNVYAVKVLAFAVETSSSTNGNNVKTTNYTVYDANGAHEAKSGTLIKPVESIVTIPKVSIVLSAATDVSSASGSSGFYRYQNGASYQTSAKDYTKFRTNSVLRQTSKAEDNTYYGYGERRLFYVSAVGLQVTAGQFTVSAKDNPTSQTSGMKLYGRAVYYKNGNVVPINEVNGLGSTVDYMGFPSGTTIQIEYRLRIDKTLYNNKRYTTDFYKQSPDTFKFYGMMKEVDTVDGTTITNTADSNEFVYTLKYETYTADQELTANYNND